MRDSDKEFWSGEPGAIWADEADFFDANHAQVTAELIRRAGIERGDRVLDIGCGAGTSVRAAAAETGPEGEVTGFDVSDYLVAAAREKGPDHARFVVGDAETHPFETGAFDRILSQFGVMFFADSRAAFANLRRAVQPGGQMLFAAWAGPEVNPWFALPGRVAVEEVGPVDSDPDAPGPMRFRDIGKVGGMLGAAGWQEVGGEPVEVILTPPGGAAAAADFVTRMGGAKRILLEREADETARLRVRERIAVAFGQFEVDGEMRVPAVINYFQARA